MITSGKNRISDPLAQAGMLLIGCLFCQLIALLVSIGSDEINSIPWIIAGTTTLCYAFFSAVISLQTKNVAKYFSRSVIGYFYFIISW